MNVRTIFAVTLACSAGPVLAQHSNTSMPAQSPVLSPMEPAIAPTDPAKPSTDPVLPALDPAQPSMQPAMPSTEPATPAVPAADDDERVPLHERRKQEPPQTP